MNMRKHARPPREAGRSWCAGSSMRAFASRRPRRLRARAREPPASSWRATGRRACRGWRTAPGAAPPPAPGRPRAARQDRRAAPAAARPPAHRPARGSGMSTVARILRHRGPDRLSSPGPPPAANRCVWDHPGDLLHLDTRKLGRCRRPGHRAARDRRAGSPGAGRECAHVAIDDASRAGFATIAADERAGSACRALPGALRYFSGRPRGRLPARHDRQRLPLRLAPLPAAVPAAGA